MLRILFDTNVPVGLRTAFPGKQVSTTFEVGWGAFANGELLAAAENDGYDIMVTADQNVRYQ